MATSPRDFLAVATPGAGKTTFALTLATELIARGVVDKLTVVCPTCKELRDSMGKNGRNWPFSDGGKGSGK